MGKRLCRGIRTMKNPCEYCTSKREDEWGLICDISCGKHSAYKNYQVGIKEVVDFVLAHKETSLFNKHGNIYIDPDELDAKLNEWDIISTEVDSSENSY